MKRLLILFLVVIVYNLISTDFQENSAVQFLQFNVSIDLLIVAVYLFILSSKGKFLFPSSIFVFFFYAYLVLGKLIWIYRENNWFNESGDPKEMAIYFSFVGVIFILTSLYGLFRNYNPSTGNETKNSIFISQQRFLSFTILCFIGAFLFTNQFRHVALFSENMDAVRVATASESEGGRGLGFILLLFGVIGNSMALLSIKKIKKFDRYKYFSLIALNTLFLALYSGRFLPAVPFVIYFIISSEGLKIRILNSLRRILFVLGAFILLMYFGARRAFGSSVDFDLAFRYIVADTFPEFRMTVYGHYLTEKIYFENFFYTIVSGSIPGPLLKIVGIDKAEYFKPIGAEILKVTHFNPAVVPGIRTSLFGELSFTGSFIYVFILGFVLIYLFLDKIYFRAKVLNFHKYRILLVSIFLAFSIPYGSLFLVSVIQLTLITYLLEKLVFNVK